VNLANVDDVEGRTEEQSDRKEGKKSLEEGKRKEKKLINH
jgi:hypothetical protein